MEDLEAAARAEPIPEPPPEPPPEPLPEPVRPNVARVYDYLLGGKDNYAVDRALGDQIIAGVPTVQVGVRAQRELLGRVVRYLVAEQGVRQLID
ncbi:MAG: SAM-dependent methyltransferase, partial [Streptosporangiaceae bacterium]